jgi:DNA-binding LacI/PurR family transcriptional regulator
MGQLGAEMLLRQMRNQEAAEGQRVLLKETLAIRESTRPLGFKRG